MARFFLERVVLLISAVAVLAFTEWVVALALGLHRSQWTFFGTAFGLVVALRLWIAWGNARPASRITGTARRWWRAHIAWETAHPVLGGATDGLVIFTLAALWSVVFDQPDDLTLQAAAECGAFVFAFSATLGVIGTRRSRRRTA